ncbi:MAG TPA: replication-associated recombination protein A [Clostridiaceae bacterium]|nr:replication-associated recombination protein A [Clostridiaceae bacterium]
MSLGGEVNDRVKEPLAWRMAPRNLSEFIGQSHILGDGKLLRRMIEVDQLSSIILFGPPGTGKTSLAKVIAATTESTFKQLNAVTAGVKDIKLVIEDAQNPLLTPSGRAVLFIDEIHRFNKAQQDALLPQVEDGTIVLIGATTENPFFEVNKALLSRSTVFQLFPLTETDILTLLDHALSDKERGYGDLDIKLTTEARMFIANVSDGDGRRALNALELAVLSTPLNESGSIVIDLETAADCMQRRSINYDSTGESHYDTISAFIKSMRGSDPDAAVFYLARALKGGESIEFLARRIMICAAEDVGMANPNALLVAVAAYQGAVAVGMPEARILLSEAAVMVATSPKSNASYMAINKAMDDVEKRRTGDIPMHIRNAPVKGMDDLGYGQGYKYAHDYPGNIVDQQYLPDEMVGTRYYCPTANGYEKRIKDWLDQVMVRRQKEVDGLDQ